MREAYPNPATTGTPKHYSQWSDSFFVLGPTPDAAYEVWSFTMGIILHL